MPPATIPLSTLVNLPGNRELAVVGFVVSSYTALLAVTGGAAGLTQGTCAIVTMNGNDTFWTYNGSGWVNQTNVFYDTFANIQAGTFQGKAAARTGSIMVTTDTNQAGWYQAVTSTTSWFN